MLVRRSTALGRIPWLTSRVATSLCSGLLRCPSRLPRRGRHLARGPLADDAPDEARFALQVGQRLKAHCEANGLSMNAVSRATNVHTQTVINLLAGKTWGDLPIIYRLEAGLGARLWEHGDLP